MSTIGSNLDPLSRGNVNLLDGQSVSEQAPANGTTPDQNPASSPDPDAPSSEHSDLDPGEKMLLSTVWNHLPAGIRQLSGDPALQQTLMNLPLSAAVDTAVDAVFDAVSDPAE